MRRSTSFSPARRRCKVSPSSRGLGAWLLLLGEQCPGRFWLERFREQEPLPELASEGDQALALRRGLDSLRDHNEAEVLRQVNDRAHDLQISAARTHAVHEGPIDTMRPVCSASGRNSCGKRTRRLPWCQRSKASNAYTRPVSISTIGWNTSRNSLRPSASRKSASIPERAWAQFRISTSKTWKHARPRSLARYMARSASRSMSGACS